MHISLKYFSIFAQLKSTVAREGHVSFLEQLETVFIVTCYAADVLDLGMKLRKGEWKGGREKA